MIKFKNYIKSITYTLIILLILTFILTILSYFNIIGNKLLTILEFIAIIVSTLIGGIIIGKNAKKQGWIEGIKISLIFIILLIVLNILLINKKLDYTNLIYYLIITISTTLGSMIGINKKS